MVSQIELIAVIARYLDKCGHTHLLPRQYNAVIEAANLIIDELSDPERKVTPGMGLQGWLASDQTGVSSKFMAGVLGEGYRGKYGHPHDPSDFGRCVGLLDACPELRGKLHLMNSHGPEWKALVDHWDELEALYREEFPTGSAPKLYEKMKHYYAEYQAAFEIAKQ